MYASSCIWEHTFSEVHIFYRRKMKLRSIFLEQHFWRRKKSQNQYSWSNIFRFQSPRDYRDRPILQACWPSSPSLWLRLFEPSLPGQFLFANAIFEGGDGGWGAFLYQCIFMDELFRHFDGFHLYAHRPSLFVVICYCYCFENFERTHTLLLSMSIIKITDSWSGVAVANLVLFCQ